jgi:hypothetical protein
VTETEESAAKSPEEKDVLTFIKQGHNTAIQAIETAMSVRAAVVNAKELEKKRVEANARIAAKEQRAKDDAKWNWFCPADPVQRGAIKATFMDCDAAVAFGSGSKGQLQGDCTRLFRIASSQAYGDALLKYSRMIVTCTTINTLSPEQRSAGMAQEKAASSAINAEGEAKKAKQQH